MIDLTKGRSGARQQLMRMASIERTIDRSIDRRIAGAIITEIARDENNGEK